jgi:aminoglycoside phosphotransferase family enzyme/predicted kinase
VELVQTHVSFVLLAGDYVYKIKKPVDFGFLDYSSLGKRRYYCRQEVLLNRRLCSDTYLGVVPIRRHNGRFLIDTGSLNPVGDRNCARGAPRAGLSGDERRAPIVEYAVLMRRLPERRMMHRMLERGEVTTGMVRSLADRIAAFHRVAETSPSIARYGNWAIRFNWRENIDQWQAYVGRTLTPEQDRILKAYGEAFFVRRADLLEKRVRELRVRRIHADLRSDAVCFRDGDEGGDVCIFDCVEFSRRINQLDIARDTGFLVMDLEYRGRPDLARQFMDRYLEVAGDPDHREVLDFYACYSACVRGKVESFLLDQPEVPEREKRRARAAARRYFALACRYAESLPPTLLMITCGLAGSGKSTLVSRLAAELGFEVLASDVLRKELAGIAPTGRGAEEYGGGIYTPEFTRRTYATLIQRARELLLSGRSVILDATFIRREHRRAAMLGARAAGAQFACLLLEVSPGTARKRLERRERRARRGLSLADPSDARWPTYLQQRRRFQRPSEVPPDRLVRIDSERPLRFQLQAVLRALKTISPLSVSVSGR